MSEPTRLTDLWYRGDESFATGRAVTTAELVEALQAEGYIVAPKADAPVVWWCAHYEQRYEEWLAVEGDDWSNAICLLNADGVRRSGHERCGRVALVRIGDE